MAVKKKVSIMGSGNFGSTIARIVGKNCLKNSDIFESRVDMYCFEEKVNGRNLTEIINTYHENVKYLPGYKFTENVVANPDLADTAKDADIMVWVLPHQFVQRACEALRGKVKPNAIAVSLIKGFAPGHSGEIKLISEVIHEILGLQVCVMMGANLATEVAQEQFCEATMGCRDSQAGKLLKKLIETDYYKITLIQEVATIEVYGALKNIVAVAGGFVDGLGCGNNTKAAIIRLGLLEMVQFSREFYPGSTRDTFFQSCGIADLITTCYGGRNRKLAEAFVKTSKSFKELELELLNGQRLQGPQTAEEVYVLLEKKKKLNDYPILTGVYRICTGEIPASMIVDIAKEHWAHKDQV